MLDRLRLMQQNGRLDAGEASFLRIAAQEPNNRFAKLGLCLCALLRGDMNASREKLAAISAEGTEDPEFAIELARSLRDLGRLPEACDLLSPFNEHLGCVSLRGEIARARGNVSLATACFEQAHRLSPTNASPLSQLVAMFREQGLYDQGLSSVERLRAIGRPHEVTAELAAGQLHRRRGDRARALAAFESAARLKPGDPQIIVEMANEWQHLGQLHRAKALLADALAIDEAHLGANLELVSQFRAAGDWEKAISILSMLAAHHPKRVNIRLQLSFVLNESGRREEADRLLEELENELGPLPEIASARISRLQESGYLREALEASRAAQLLYPRHFGLWTQGMGLELRLSEKDVVEQYLDLAPSVTAAERAQVWLKRLQLDARDWQLARGLMHGDAMQEADAGGLTGASDLFRLNLLTLDLVAARGYLRRVSASRSVTRKLQGKSVNESQSFEGQMYNEFMLDGRALAELVTNRDMPSMARLGALVAMASRNPDHIPTAMLTMVALQESGLLFLRHSREHEGEPIIPSTIGQYWDATTPPPDLMELHESWSRLNPQHSVRLFNHNTATAYLSDNFPPQVKLAYARATDPARRADLFRLAYLWIEGGFWVDMDDRATSPLSSIVPPSAQAAFRQEEWGTLGNNFIGVHPRMRMIGWALEVAVASINRGDTDLLWFTTGPGLMTRAFVQTMLCGSAVLETALRDVVILDSLRLGQGVSIHAKTSHKKARKHWSDTAYGGNARREPPPHQVAVA